MEDSISTNGGGRETGGSVQVVGNAMAPTDVEDRGWGDLL